MLIIKESIGILKIHFTRFWILQLRKMKVEQEKEIVYLTNMLFK